MMEKKFSGKIWKFGNDIDTDTIIPGKRGTIPTIEEMKKYAFELLKPEFGSTVQAGDILVAGSNFGCGSSREQAPLALKGAGVAAVVARSFARIFYRNAINVGLALIEADVVCDKGDTVEVDLAEGLVRVGDKTYQGSRLPDFLRAILDDGGLVAHRRKEKGLA